MTWVKFRAGRAEAQGNVATGKAGEAHGASNEPGDNPHTTRLAARSLRPLRVAVLGRRLDQPRRQLGPRGRTGRGRAGARRPSPPPPHPSDTAAIAAAAFAAAPVALPADADAGAHRTRRRPRACRSAPIPPPGTEAAVAAPTAEAPAHAVGGDRRVLPVVRRPARVVPLGPRPRTAAARPPRGAHGGDRARQLRARDDRRPRRGRHRRRCLPAVGLGHHRAGEVPPLGLRRRPRHRVLHRRHGARHQRTAVGPHAGVPVAHRSSCRS